jgi:hypothetical protein
MNSLLLKATRQRAQSRLYESSSLAHRMIIINQDNLTTAINECETLDELSRLTDEFENMIRNPNELIVQFNSLSKTTIGKKSALPHSVSALRVITENEVESDDSMYEFLGLYDSDVVVDYRKFKDSADSILDEISAANLCAEEEDAKEEDGGNEDRHCENEETPVENDSITDMLMKSFVMPNTSVTKRKNKSPRNGDESDSSPHGDKKRGRPPINPADKKPKVKKIKAKKECDHPIAEGHDENTN